MYLLGALLLLCIGCIGGQSNGAPDPKVCPIGKRSSSPESVGDSCVYLENIDIQRAIRAVAYPPILRSSDKDASLLSQNDNERYANTYTDYDSKCLNFTVSQGIRICEDLIQNNLNPSLLDNLLKPPQCIVYSIIATSVCNYLGSLEFEKYWSSRGCEVRLFHFTYFYKGNNCEYKEDLAAYPNIKATVYDIWGGKGYMSFYKQLPPVGDLPLISILKIQSREGVFEDFEGVPFTIMSDLYLHRRDFFASVQQMVFTAVINSETLVDSVGRESEYAWNIWASSQYLINFDVVYSERHRGMSPPVQFDYLLEPIHLDPQYAYYQHTFVQNSWIASLKGSGKEKTKETLTTVQLDSIRKQKEGIIESFLPKQSAKRMVARAPKYCEVPSEVEDQEMQRWINKEILVRCHATRLWVNCDHDRPYDAFIPCKQELIDNLAEDYAASKNWCNYNSFTSDIVSLQNVPREASETFHFKNKPVAGVRLAFFFTVYHDSKHISRLVQRLYSEDHYYLIHVDPGGSTLEFEKDMHKLADSMPRRNVFIVRDVPIVYGAATATIVLVKAMAWYLRHASSWDYFVPVTGADYPLVPLKRIEKMFAYQLNSAQGPMPFVMAWSPGTSTHLFRLATTHPYFDKNMLIKNSIFPATTRERGDPLGSGGRFMEYRSNNFGPPLFCNNKHSFYHLDNRLNKSGLQHDTQWLFPRDRFAKRGRAFSEEDPAKSYLPPDGKFRVWKKSDPATTGAYDFETIKYIVNSEEGKKYFHFFKHMLLGSEEHYFVNLLYNWERTKAFVQSLSAQIVWNTWELGLWEQAGGFQTHTHFLTNEEWHILRGFALRGMIFARKFSTKKTPELLDKIDSYIHFNETTDAGLFWPGYFPVDQHTVGKLWIAESRRNQTREFKARFREYTRLTIRAALLHASGDEVYTDKYLERLVAENLA